MRITSFSTPRVSMRKPQVAAAPSSEAMIKPTSKVVAPMACSRMGNRKAVATAPIFAKEAAKPAP